MKVQCLLQRFTTCYIVRDLRMLHIKMLICSAVPEFILTNKNGEFSGQMQINYHGFQRPLAVVCS